MEREMAGVKQALEADVEFISVFKLKENQNERGPPFKGLGMAKTLKLIGKGITTVRESLECAGGAQSVLPQWRQSVENCHDELEVELGALVEQLSKLQEDHVWACVVIDMDDEESDEPGESNLDVSATTAEERVSPFSPLVMDAEHCNGWVMSKCAKDRTAATDFECRKATNRTK